METSDPTARLEALLALRGDLVASGERTRRDLCLRPGDTADVTR